MITSRIVGTGSYVPEQIVTNDDLAKIVDTNDEWIRTRTGIRQRRLVTAEGTSQMAARAARKALEQSGVKPEEIELIILGTSSQDYCFPSGACEVQAMIGAVNAVCYDLSAACTGFVYALNTAHAFIKAGIYRTALIIGSDVLSKLIDWSDRSTCVLFGDGAGAAVVKADETGVLGMRMYSDGTKGDVLTCGARTNGISSGQEAGAWLYDHEWSGGIQVRGKKGSGGNPSGAGGHADAYGGDSLFCSSPG